MRRFAAGAAAAALFAASGAQAQDRSAAAWRQLTQADVEAAYALLSEDHPASLAEVGDSAFRQRLADGYALARERAAGVASFQGYAATMAGFANAMGDKHVWSRTMVAPTALNWPGFLVARRGNDWIVADEENGAEGDRLAGARLVSCDGIPAAAFAERQLGGFRAIWSVGAQRTSAAPWLMVDEGNPFVTRPSRCTFDRDGASREVTLNWRSIGRSELVPRMRGIVRRGQAGFGVRRAGAGYWISIQSLSDQARPVVEAVRGQAAEMRRAPFVVLDMRGNSGGDSGYGDQILEALLGPAAARGDGDGETESCNPAWRISPRNLAVLDSIERRAAAAQAPGSDFWIAQHRRAHEAAAAGRALSGPAACGRVQGGDEPRRRPAGSLYPGRLIVLTDYVCFSSCLLVTDRFRRLGALHVGEETDAATRYFEVREERLPSGLSMFSTLQALSPTSPPQIGPFVPDRLYDGDISDTAALETWVASLAAQGDVQ